MNVQSSVSKMYCMFSSMLILLGVGSSRSVADVRMVLVFFNFALMYRLRTYGKTSSEVPSGDIHVDRCECM